MGLSGRRPASAVLPRLDQPLLIGKKVAWEPGAGLEEREERIACPAGS
jgi:hypothetical protein